MLTDILALVEARRLEDAEALALTEVALRPEDAECWSLLAVLAVQRGDLGTAVERSDRALAADPASARAWLNRGNLEGLRGDRAAAVRAYERVLAIHPSSDAAEFNLAIVAEEDGRSEEAEERYRRILTRSPGHPETLYNLARLLAATPGGRHDEAAAVLYARATQAAPLHVASWRNRAHLLRRLGRDDEAADCYRQVLVLEPGDATSRHLLAALEGAALTGAEPAYVEALFDRFASTYDEDFAERLGSEAAPRLVALLLAAAPWLGTQTGLSVLDAGCGTGLFLAELAQRIGPSPGLAAVGVDLSAAMLARAEARGLYAELVQAELLVWLAQSRASFDLVAACDVFGYLGDPAPLLSAVGSRLRAGGLLAFTAEYAPELPAGMPAVLSRSGRFQHAEEPLRIALRTAGYELRAWSRGPLRRERGEAVEGIYAVAARAETEGGQE